MTINGEKDNQNLIYIIWLLEEVKNLIMSEWESISDLSKFLIYDFNLILPNDLLKKMDIATMANSLEGRSPFLSKYMLELAPSLSDELKVIHHHFRQADKIVITQFFILCCHTCCTIIQMANT